MGTLTYHSWRQTSTNTWPINAGDPIELECASVGGTWRSGKWHASVACDTNVWGDVAASVVEMGRVNCGGCLVALRTTQPNSTQCTSLKSVHDALYGYESEDMSSEFRVPIDTCTIETVSEFQILNIFYIDLSIQ